MRLSRLSVITPFLLAAALCVPAWGANSALPANPDYSQARHRAESAPPGTINYVEGQAAIGSLPLNSKAVGVSALQGGQSLSTGAGKAELLLTPGVFLRVGDNSSLKMVSPSLTRTEVSLSSGQAMVEVDQIHKSNDLLVAEDGATTRLLKRGLYGFDANSGQVRVFKGQARVREGKHQVKLGGSHQVTLNPAGKLKSRHFDKKAYEGSLYRFSKLRSDYIAQANAKAVQYVYNGWSGPGWGWSGGWGWNPWFGGYTFFPGSGVFYSPFAPSPFFSGTFGDHHFFGREHGFFGREHGFIGRGGGFDHDRGFAGHGFGGDHDFAAHGFAAPDHDAGHDIGR